MITTAAAPVVFRRNTAGRSESCAWGWGDRESAAEKACEGRKAGEETMVRLYGREWGAEELLRRVGSLDQLGGIIAGERSDGTARGVRTLDVQTGGGLSFTVLPERGLDIGEARLHGVPLAWHSAMGVVHPSRHE